MGASSSPDAPREAVLGNRGPEDAWLSERLIARPLGHCDMEADWTKVFDEFVFTRRMFGYQRVAAD